MTPRGAQALIALRKAGKRPKGDVWISFGDFREPDWWLYGGMPELLVRSDDPVDRVDLRCVVELPVILFFDKWNEKVAALYEQLTGFASEICVMSPEFEEDIGWWWHKQYGRLEWGERRYLTQFQDALAECTVAARKNNKAAYAAAKEKELDALKHWRPHGRNS